MEDCYEEKNCTTVNDGPWDILPGRMRQSYGGKEYGPDIIGGRHSSRFRQNKNVTLSFGTHQSGIPSCGVLQDLAGQFEEETGIKIDFQVSPDAQWRDLLKVKLDSGEAPDIFCVDADPLSLYSRVRPDETCVDLSGEEWVNRMADYAKECVSYDDKIYAIRFAEPKLNFYNYNKKYSTIWGWRFLPPTKRLKQSARKFRIPGPSRFTKRRRAHGISAYRSTAADLTLKSWNPAYTTR